MKTRLRCLSLALLFAVLAVGDAHAISSGIFDRAAVGCGGGGCHGGIIPPDTVTRAVITGLPSGGYVPGTTYELMVFVLGAGLPTTVTTAENRGGFNLQASAGSIQPKAGDLTLQAHNRTECDIVKYYRASCDPDSTCGVATTGPEGGALCTTNTDCFGRTCQAGTPGCRLCSQAIVDIQATHARAGGVLAGTPASPWTDGNSVLFWQLDWTAPEAGAGDVVFSVAGNAVNGNGTPDPGDNYSVTVQTVPQAP